MVRMARSRRKDAVNRRAARERHGPTFGGLWEPPLSRGDAPVQGSAGAAVRGAEQRTATNGEMEDDEEDVHMDVPIGTLEDIVPETDDWRAVLARDPLAGVDGFRVVVGLVFEYILGMRYCPQCPNCECSDLLGSNATAVGGSLGRVDGVYGSIEAQKSAGSLHLHVQVFVQCLHQHTPLHEIVQLSSEKMSDLVEGYKRYKMHACRQEYDDGDGWRSRKAEVEKAWPAHNDTTDLATAPAHVEQ